MPEPSTAKHIPTWAWIAIPVAATVLLLFAITSSVSSATDNVANAVGPVFDAAKGNAQLKSC